MGSFNVALLEALLSVGVPPDRARAVVDLLDRSIDERYGLHAQVLATKRDVAEAQLALGREIAEVRVSLGREVAETRAALGREIAAIGREVAELDARTSKEIARTQAQIAETRADLVKWALAALTAQTVLLLGAMRLL